MNSGIIRKIISKVNEIKLKMYLDKLRGKKIVILDIEETTFIPHILPIVKALKKKTDRISFYISTHHTGNPEFKSFEVTVEKQFDVSLSRHIPQADIFISTHIYGRGNDKSIRIHVNHNQPVKYEAYQKKDFVNFNVHFLTSPLHKEQTLNTIKKYSLENRGISYYETGYSKSDALLRGEYNRETVLTELKLNPSLKTVLYAPSWDEGLSLRMFGEKVIEEILKVDNINLIVKLHPISYYPESGPNYLFYTGGINWMEKFSRFEAYQNFRHIPSSDIDPILAASDLMVTDVSSVALEFIPLDKPVIYIDCPEFFEKTLRKIYSGFGDTTADYVRNDPKANAGRHVGAVVYDINELPAEIIRTLKNPGELSGKRIEFAKQLNYNPGNAADTAAGKILELLEIKNAKVN